MLYSKNEEQLLKKVNELIKSEETEDQYKNGLNKWLIWYKSINTLLPELEKNSFYRAYVKVEEEIFKFAVQIWEHDGETDINVWKMNFIANDHLEDNTDMTQIKQCIQ